MTIVTEDGGLTALGYGVFAVSGIVLLIIASFIAGKYSSKSKFSAKQLAFCAMGLALAFVLSYIRFSPFPWGGGVTLCSMLIITLIAYWYGPATGIMIGFAFGILQFIQEPFVLSPFQVCCDYVFAFAALGLAGFFKDKKHGMIIGYLVGIVARGAFHALGGYLYWMDYMPEEFPQNLAALYPIIYNYSYILMEGVVTIVILCIPSVSQAIKRIGNMATQ